MRAFISGQAGIAILIDGEEYSSIDVHSCQTVPRAAHDVGLMVADATDLVELEGISKNDAARELDVAWRKDRSLHLTLIALDRDAARENRTSSVSALIELLSDSSITDFVRNRLYAGPLPPSADLPGALELAESLGSSEFASILREVDVDQEFIRRNRIAWDALRPDLFGGAEEKERFGFTAVESGVFRLLAHGNPNDAPQVFFSFSQERRFEVNWDVRRLVKRWQKTSELIVNGASAQDLISKVSNSSSKPSRMLSTGLAAGAFISRHRLLAAAAGLLLGVFIVSSQFTLVAKNTTRLTPAGTGGIQATGALLRSELPFSWRGAAAFRYFEQAANALSKGEFSKAARWYQQSREAADTLAAQLNFGIAVYNTADLTNAASIIEKGLMTARQNHVEVLESAFLTNLGNIYRDQGLLDQAERVYQEAHQIDVRNDQKLGLASNYYNRGLAFVMRGKFTEALADFNISHTAFQELGNEVGEADVLMARAPILRMFENPAYVSDLKTAAALYSRVGGALAEANYHLAVGQAEFYQGYDHPNDKVSTERALENYLQSYAIYERIGYRQGQALAMCGLGNIYHQRSDSAKAMASYTGCLAICRQIGSPFREAIALGSVGLQYVSEGKSTDAIRRLTDAAELADKIGAWGVKANSLQQIGSIYAKSGDEQHALSYFESSVTVAEEKGDRFLSIDPLQEIASSYLRLHDFDKGRKALVKLRELYAAFGNYSKSSAVQRKIDQLPE